ncbi:MAG: nicotinamide-nucleotide amidohydrolase family protein [Pleurocapsa minor GSE-CHR-MK-17-07R]|nr:nicotinamide-nucleotide amidohydrolase family protein [Pleurocapsa minor GSE-CHR-MK 17-07R]
MDSNQRDDLAVQVGQFLLARGWTMSAAESCTGGLLMERLTRVPGSSAYVIGGIVAYAYEAKQKMLGVPANMLIEHGAVSAEVAQAMALGALGAFNTDVSVGITGIAGPGGGTPEKPVGLVYICAAHAGGLLRVERNVFSGNRDEIRHASASRGLHMLMELDEVSGMDE